MITGLMHVHINFTVIVVFYRRVICSSFTQRIVKWLSNVYNYPCTNHCSLLSCKGLCLLSYNNTVMVGYLHKSITSMNMFA